MHENQEAAPHESGDRKSYKVVYTIVERGNDRKPVWLRIGAAFVNRDQSINVKLDAHPQNGTLHIRDYVPQDEYRRRSDESAAGQSAGSPRKEPYGAPFRAQNGAIG